MEMSGIYSISVFMKYTLSQAQMANDETTNKTFHHLCYVKKNVCMNPSS